MDIGILRDSRGILKGYLRILQNSPGLLRDPEGLSEDGVDSSWILKDSSGCSRIAWDP